jgi:hypothetical protein
MRLLPYSVVPCRLYGNAGLRSVRCGEGIMRTYSVSAIVIVAFLAFVIPISAQENAPKYEVGMGFSFMRSHIPGSSDLSNLNGIQFDTTYNLNRWLGLTGEFTGHKRCLAGCYWDGSVARDKAFTFAAGPRLSMPRDRRVVPWVHLLGGVSNISYSDDFGVDEASTGYAVVAGGGLDVPINSIIIRPIQVDLIRHKVDAEVRNDLRIGVGIAIGWGGGKKTK